MLCHFKSQCQVNVLNSCLLSFSDLYSNDTCAPLWGCVCPAFQMTSGGICPMGYYCPVGSSQPSACTPGMYCETPGLPLPTGADLDNLIMFNLYFILDTLNQKLWDQVLPSVKNHQDKDKNICWNLNLCLKDILKYCFSSYIGNCSAGWYCNHTSSTKYQHMCPAGSYCPSGSDIPTPCPAGTYSGLDNNGALTDCLNCTAGHYCHGNVLF